MTFDLFFIIMLPYVLQYTATFISVRDNMLLSELLKNTDYSCPNFEDTDVNSICYDSRKACAGSIFFCLEGSAVDGHSFICSAYENGCRIFAVSRDIEWYSDAMFIKFDNTRKALAVASANFFKNPAEKLTVIGITGTKGKTSISFMLRSIFEEAGRKVGIIGTTGTIYADVFEKSDNSTPESYVIHEYFSDMAAKGIDTVVMEVSSQGLKMFRTYGIDFDAAVYTNLSRDHIGPSEHSSFEEYRDCKAILFGQCKKAFINCDDENWEYVAKAYRGTPIFFSITPKADFYAEDITYGGGDSGLKTAYTLCTANEKYHIDINIPGKFSVYNSLAAAACASYFGASRENIRNGLCKAVVEGRMQKVEADLPYTVIIDYAHNELSMENLYDTISNYPHNRIISLFGCGGNRSKDRRYDMGRIAAQYSELCVITSDNPRFESLDSIIDDIKIGLAQGKEKNPGGEYVVIKDRKKAIFHAMDCAKPGDVILITGKGHQHYEEIEGVKYPFCEKDIVLEYAKSVLGLKG